MSLKDEVKKYERVAASGDPLDMARGFGPDDMLFDLHEVLQNLDDPLRVLCMCEEVDLAEGWTAGTALALYYCSHDKYHYPTR